MHQYVVIKDLNKLASKLPKQKFRSENQLCRNCFQGCLSAKRLERPQLVCVGHEAAVGTMPDDNKNGVRFKKFAARSYSHFAVYSVLNVIVRESRHGA